MSESEGGLAVLFNRTENKCTFHGGNFSLDLSAIDSYASEHFWYKQITGTRRGAGIYLPWALIQYVDVKLGTNLSCNLLVIRLYS